MDDFQWLKAGQSPNWSVLPIEKRISDEAWRAVLAPEPEISVEDILTAMHVQ